MKFRLNREEATELKCVQPLRLFTKLGGMSHVCVGIKHNVHNTVIWNTSSERRKISIFNSGLAPPAIKHYRDSSACKSEYISNSRSLWSCFLVLLKLFISHKLFLNTGLREWMCWIARLSENNFRCDKTKKKSPMLEVERSFVLLNYTKK